MGPSQSSRWRDEKKHELLDLADIFGDGTLLLGAEPLSVDEWDFLFKRWKVKHVVRCVMSPPDPETCGDRLGLQARSAGFRLLHLPVEDVVNCNLGQYFQSSALFIEEGLRGVQASAAGSHGVPKGPVFVHCQRGASRSVAILLSYLVQYRHMTVKHALDQVVRPVRPIARPNQSFIAQLAELEVERALARQEGGGREGKEEGVERVVLPSLDAHLYVLDAAEERMGWCCPRSVMEKLYYSEQCGQVEWKLTTMISEWREETNTCTAILRGTQVVAGNPSGHEDSDDTRNGDQVQEDVELIRSLLRKHHQDSEAAKTEYLKGKTAAASPM